MRKATHRGFPVECWQQPGQTSAWATTRFPQLGEDEQWQQMADDRNAKVAQYYEQITHRPTLRGPHR